MPWLVILKAWLRPRLLPLVLLVVGLLLLLQLLLDGCQRRTQRRLAQAQLATWRLVLLDSVLQAQQAQERHRYDSLEQALRRQLLFQQQRSQELQRREQQLETQYRAGRVVLPKL
ncbi:hypothetical protein [Hymenobacter glacieicola]|uniref:Uncharacterized protein n=1 Tax=Hymenobacter glacieicola TaxID=1562124 RepID=A0ABQ1X8E7_9BACT|nr:hypothetical protein [Hymenobacter glacieicola]GGG60479.1 hypothetical protein GCM10011378_40600 [Hymenobacter glacieicola]